MNRAPAPLWGLASLALLAALATVPGCGGGAGYVRGSGTVELDEVDVASLVGGRIRELRVDEGDSVAIGDTLVILDRGELAADLVARAAEADRALAEWRDLRAGARQEELEAARADLDAARAEAELAEAELQRVAALHEAEVASPAAFDQARTAREAAAARRAAAAERLRLLEAGTRRDQVSAARNAASAARAQLDATRSLLDELVLTAPVAGVVLLKNFEPGEIVGTGVPVVALGNPDSLWMRVYVATPQIGRVRLGAPVEVRVIGLKDPFAGRVIEIATSAEFTPRAALTEEEQANLVFGVKVAIDPSAGRLKAGLPAEARILEPTSEEFR